MNITHKDLRYTVVWSITLPETKSLLKLVLGKQFFPFGAGPSFRGKLLVSGEYLMVFGGFSISIHIEKGIRDAHSKKT